MKTTSKTAFTMFELMGVILVIAVIFIAVLGTQKFVSASRLAAARNMTAFSPVNSIDGLVLWLDATSKDAFDKGEDVDGALVTNWYDLNQQSFTKHNGSSSGTARPTYIKDGIKNLPALDFDGSNDLFTLSAQPIHGSVARTIFIVATADVVDGGAIVSLSNINTGGGKYDVTGEIGIRVSNGNKFYANDSILNEPSIVTLMNDINSDVLDNVAYKNGGSPLTATSSLDEVINTNIGTSKIGSDTAIAAFFNGLVGEIIIYQRFLNTSEREDIEEYLSKKWRIDLN
ncbi:MAG: hypothetical protein O3B09_01295 [Proteobacteria bacterium]|nr:hypothetical protein [Pseudomonadota bacterium]